MLTIPIFLMRRIEIVARKKKISREKAIIFLLKKVITPSQAAKKCSK